jgi:hypothetical protein
VGASGAGSTGIAASATRSRSALTVASASVAPGINTANSSPPRRAGVSTARIFSRNAVASRWSTWSPLAWPHRSFTFVK